MSLQIVALPFFIYRSLNCFLKIETLFTYFVNGVKCANPVPGPTTSVSLSLCFRMNETNLYLKMDMDFFHRVKNALNSKHYVMNDSWLQDCLEYCINECNHSKTDLLQILEFITSQWHLSDLREINNEQGSLPKNLTEKTCTTLPGKYILQMDKMYDISTPKFKQLEQIRNISTDNINATEITDSQPWEVKSKRMLQLFLTDGIQNVTAIEYKMLNCLNNAIRLLPGYKLMIKGPVICRRGVILLEDVNLDDVGGEVENLLIPNATENVLARCLNLPENPNPYPDSKLSQNNADALFDDKFDIDIDAVVQIEKESQMLHSSKKSSAQIQNSIQSFVENISSTQNNSFDQRNQQSNDFPNDEEIMDIIDQEQLMLNQPDNVLVSNFVNSKIRKEVDTPGSPNQFDTSSTLIAQNELINISDEDFDFEDFNTFSTNIVTTESSFKTTKMENSKVQIFNSREENNIANFFNPNTKPKRETPQSSTFFNIEKSNNKNLVEKQASKTNINTKNNKPQLLQSNLKPLKNEDISLGFKRSSDKLSPPTESNPQKMRCVQETMKMRTIKDLTLKSVIEESPTRKLCDFLCNVLKEPLTDERVTRTIRGKVVTLSKLNIIDSQWSLSGKLTDTTSNIEVTFSSEVLDNIFGLNAQEFKEKKKMKKMNPELMKKLVTDLQNAEVKLKGLDALVVLELSKNKQANVIKISELNEEQKRLIDQQIKNQVLA